MVDSLPAQRREGRTESEAFRLRALSSVAEVDRHDWNSLLGSDPSPFARWEWLHAFEESGAAATATGWTPAHLTLWRAGRLVGAAPAWLKAHSMGEYIYDFGWAQLAQQLGVPYYPKLVLGAPLSPATAPRFLTAHGEDRAQLRALLAQAAVELAREVGASSVHVLYPPEEDALALQAQGFFLRGTLQFHWRNPGYRSWDQFLSRFSSKRRHQLRREQRAASEQGIALRTVRGEALGAEHAELGWRLYEETNLKHPWGHLQLNPEFFGRVVETMGDCVEVVEARRGEQVVAGAFNLVHRRAQGGDRLYGRYWGCFEEHPFLHFNVCLYHSIDECIRLGRAVFEPGAGGEHKISRGFEPTLVHSAHVVFDRGLDRLLRSAAAKERAQLEETAGEAELWCGLKPWQGAS